MRVGSGLRTRRNVHRHVVPGPGRAKLVAHSLSVNGRSAGMVNADRLDVESRRRVTGSTRPSATRLRSTPGRATHFPCRGSHSRSGLACAPSKSSEPDTPVWMPVDKLDRALRLGLNGLRGVHPWESHQVDGIRLTVVPAVHMGGELGLVVEGDQTVYFAGDTSFDRDLFRTIAHRWRLDAALLPMGDLRILGIPIRQMGPKTASRALRLLGEPRFVVPTHYGGMSLAPFVAFKGTPRRLSESIQKAELATVLGATRPLETLEI